MKNHRGLAGLYPPFRKKVAAILTALATRASKHTLSHEWRLVEGFRTVSRQRRLYAQGRTEPGDRVTTLDGVRRKSSHQYGLAVDVVPFAAGKPRWEIAEADWQRLGRLAREFGLVWGGDWSGFRDRPHVEWPRSDRATYRAAWDWVLGGFGVDSDA